MLWMSVVSSLAVVRRDAKDPAAPPGQATCAAGSDVEDSAELPCHGSGLGSGPHGRLRQNKSRATVLRAVSLCLSCGIVLCQEPLAYRKDEM